MVPSFRRVAIAAAILAGVSSARAAVFTVTNTKNSGGGSLRTAITGANGTPGSTVQFAIPTSDSGYTAARGVFTIRITSALPAITANGTIVDGSTQTTAIGNTNPRLLGTGGTVGVDGLSLPLVAGPEIEIVDGSNLAVGIDVQATDVTIRGLAIYGFGTASNSDTSGDIRIGAAANRALIVADVLGTPADSWTDPGAGNRSIGDHVRVTGADTGTIRGSLLGYSAGKGLELNTGSNGWLVEQSEFRRNGIGNSNLDAMDIENGSGTATVRGNLLVQSEACGFESYQSSGGNLVQNNTVQGNGIGAAAGLENPGVRLYGAGNTVDRNVISGNVGAGVLVTSGSTGNTITKNSISGNGPATGEIGIDLLSAADDQNLGTTPFVTRNDAADADAGGNALLNFPVVVSATLSGGQLTLSGFARPGSAIELFLATADPSGFGEGSTYLVTLTEGSGSDLDATAGTYSGVINGLNQGTDTTNRFQFTIATPPGVATGSVLTATATLAGATSEFCGNVAVTGGPAITLVKSVAPGGAQRPGTDLAYTVVFANGGSGTANSVVVTDSVPASTDFKVGSVFTNPGTTGLTVAVAYSNNSGTTWTYVPAGGAGGAPAGYDRNVTTIRWTFTGTLSQTPPANQGNVGFVARIR
jgi:uncharacterized repeat protein (TIGR01451 family)